MMFGLGRFNAVAQKPSTTAPFVSQLAGRVLGKAAGAVVTCETALLMKHSDVLCASAKSTTSR